MMVLKIPSFVAALLIGFLLYQVAQIA